MGAYARTPEKSVGQFARVVGVFLLTCRHPFFEARKKPATFSWFGRNRRIAKDYENLDLTLAAFITLACIQIAVRRLAR